VYYREALVRVSLSLVPFGNINVVTICGGA
jgi:hypothetical protein